MEPFRIRSRSCCFHTARHPFTYINFPDNTFGLRALAALRDITRAPGVYHDPLSIGRRQVSSAPNPAASTRQLINIRSAPHGLLSFKIP